MPQSQIQATVDAISAQQVPNQFGTERYALLFEPGTYGTAANPLIFQVGYYTEVAGLGHNPGDVTINGTIDVYNQCFPTTDGSSNCIALDNFWRSLSNLTINVAGGSGCQTNTEFWAVSQAAPMRRVVVNGGTSLMDYCSAGPQYASGGFIADSAFTGGTVVNGSQQQFLVRNTNLDGWTNGVWNQVFAGSPGAPAQSFSATSGLDGGTAPYTTLATSPRDAGGAVPADRRVPARSASSCRRCSRTPPARRGPVAATAGSIAADQQVLHRHAEHLDPGDRRRARARQEPDPHPGCLQPQGADPGHPARHHRARPRLRDPDPAERHRRPADARRTRHEDLRPHRRRGPKNSPVLLQLGDALGTLIGHSASDPTLVQDVFFRIGGATAGKATTSLVVDSSDVILDDIWAWRADHGAGVGWTGNTADTGLIVNGNNVLAYGLFVEHYQKNEVIWNGQGGEVIFFQNEMPYDAPSQAAWMSSPTTNGYPAIADLDRRSRPSSGTAWPATTSSTRASRSTRRRRSWCRSTRA